MNWVFFAALIVACNAAKLDRTYLPPASAAAAGGSPGFLQTPISKSDIHNLPLGSFVNEHDGVVIDVAAAGTRTVQSGLGAPRVSYGSMDSKVGEAAFRGTAQNQAKNPVLDYNPDLSAFHQPSKPSRTEVQITRDRGANIIKYHNDISNERYSYGYETDNGIKAEENGVAINGVRAEGEFSYMGDDGKVYTVMYTADEGGYRPVGSHLPTPPPIPAEILRSLEQNSRDEAAGIFEDGSYDAQKYNTATNDKYKDRQTNKVNVQSGLGANTNGLFNNKNQVIFTRPSLSPLFGAKPEPSKLSPGTGISGTDLNVGNGFGQGQLNLGAGIGSRKEYSQKQNAQNNLSSSLDASSMNKNGSNSIPAKPLSQQELQETTSLGQVQSGIPRPSSYDTSISSVISAKIPSEDQPSQDSGTNFSTEDNKNRPIKDNQAFITPTERLPTYNINKNAGSKHMQLTLEQDKQNLSESPLGTYTPNNEFPQTTSGLESSIQTGMSSSFGLTNSGNLFMPTRPIISTKQPERTLTTPFESVLTSNNDKISATFGNNQAQYTGANFANFPEKTIMDFTSKFGNKPSSQMEFFTSKTTTSQFTPTSNNKNGLKVTNSPFNLSSQNFNTQTQQNEKNIFETIPSSASIPPNNINFFQSSQRPSSTQFNLETQRPTNSYIYNKPTKPANTAFTHPGSNTQIFPSTVSYQLNKETLSPMDTDFETERNKEKIPTTFSDNINRFNDHKYSTAAPLTTFFGNKDSYPSDGITQASISSFPSIFPTTSNFGTAGQLSFKPFMQQNNKNDYKHIQSFQPSKLTTHTVFQPSSSDTNKMEENNSQTQQYNTNIYEYNKPAPSFPPVSQIKKKGNQQVSPLNTQFGMTTPYKVEENGLSNRKNQFSFENVNVNEDYDKKTTSSVFQQTTLNADEKLTTSSITNPTYESEIKAQNSDSENTSKFEIYEYTKPSQIFISSAKEQFGQKIPTTQVTGQSEKQTTNAFTGSYSETMDSFQTEAQRTTDFDQAEFDRKTEMPEFSQTSSTFNKMPTIYQYTKPVQNIMSTTQEKNYYNSPISQNEQTTEATTSTQIGQQYFPTDNFGKKTLQNRFNSKETTSSQFSLGNQQTMTQFFNKLSTPTTSQQTLDDKFSLQDQESNGEIYDYKKPNQTFTSTEQMKINLNVRPNTEFNSGIPLHEKPQLNSQSGEIYEYSKPAQVLTTPTHSNILDQMRNQHFGQRLNKVNSQGSIFTPNLNGDKRTTNTQSEQFITPSMISQLDNSQENVSQGDNISVTPQGSSTTGINSSLSTSPQFGFYSACCRGSQFRKQHGSGSSQTIVNSQSSSERETVRNKNLEAQKLTTQPFRQRERFGGPRKPPSFDEKGYHY